MKRTAEEAGIDIEHSGKMVKISDEPEYGGMKIAVGYLIKFKFVYTEDQILEEGCHIAPYAH
jgi:hypothetical protein